MSSTHNGDTIVIASNLHFGFPDKDLFGPINFCFSNKKQGLIGANGTGKSTLLKLIMGQILPNAGTIELLGKVVLFEQLDSFCPNQTVAQLLGVDVILRAQTLLAKGDYSETRLAQASLDWDLEDKLNQLFDSWALDRAVLHRKMSSLSGGECTKVKLCHLQMQQADLIILDEPTNHLDLESKQLFKKWLHLQNSGVLLVTHDRELLEEVETIYELQLNRLIEYGGNFEHYQSIKQAQDQARQAALQSNLHTISQLKRQYQVNKEHLDKSEQIGSQRKRNEIIARGQASKMYYNDCCDKASKTFKRVTMQAKRKQALILERVKELQSHIESNHEIDNKISNRTISSHKKVLSLDKVSFGFDETVLIDALSWVGYGPFRLSISGANGSGKSTLLKLIQGSLNPHSGEIYLGVEEFKFLSQDNYPLSLEKTVFQCFIDEHPGIDHQMAHNQLSRFLFKEMKDCLVAQLSGGEKMRLKLACCLLSYVPPQLLILDEPTNHMDILSVECIEKALLQYNGALIVVSHDKMFLKNINITDSIQLSQ